MHVITGNLEEITGQPAPAGSRLRVSTPQGRPSPGGAVIYPGETPVAVGPAGDFEFEAHPGPCRVRFDLPGVTWREGPVLTVTVPEGAGPTALGTLMAVQGDYDPPIIGMVEQLMQQTVVAAGRAEDAALGLEHVLDTVEQVVEGKADVVHQHSVADIVAGGSRGAATYLRGDGSWVTPTNTTYTPLTQAEAESSSSTTARLTTGQRLYQAVLKHAPAALSTLLEGKSDKGHKHSASDITATGTASASTFLRGDGAWAVPAAPRAMTQAEADAGTLTTTMTLTPAILRAAVRTHTPVVRVTALPASPDPATLYVVVP